MKAKTLTHLAIAKRLIADAEEIVRGRTFDDSGGEMGEIDNRLIHDLAAVFARNAREYLDTLEEDPAARVEAAARAVERRNRPAKPPSSAEAEELHRQVVDAYVQLAELHRVMADAVDVRGPADDNALTLKCLQGVATGMQRHLDDLGAAC